MNVENIKIFLFLHFMKKREVMQGTMWLFTDSREWGVEIRDWGLGARELGNQESKAGNRDSGFGSRKQIAGSRKPEARSPQPTADSRKPILKLKRIFQPQPFLVFIAEVQRGVVIQGIAFC